jgi:hypothetical protein
VERTLLSAAFELACSVVIKMSIPRYFYLGAGL